MLFIIIYISSSPRPQSDQHRLYGIPYFIGQGFSLGSFWSSGSHFEANLLRLVLGRYLTP